MARRSTFREIVELVTTHGFAEEEVLFPAARSALSSGELITSETECRHQRILEILVELEGLERGTLSPASRSCSSNARGRSSGAVATLRSNASSPAR